MEKITCITICRNDKEGLLKTVESVLEQTLPPYEMIIVDGDSTDGTKQVLPEIKSRFEKRGGVRFQYVSEPDNGIYDAMNKGIDMAHGDWLIFMNAEDTFAEADTLEKVASLPIDPMTGVFYGDAYHIWADGQAVYMKSSLFKKMPDRSWTHQSTFFRRDIMQAHKYGTRYKIENDSAWMIEYHQNGGKLQYFSVPISRHQMGGTSSQSMYQMYCESLQMCSDFGIKEPTMLIWIKKIIMLAFDWEEQHSPFKTKIFRKVWENRG